MATSPPVNRQHSNNCTLCRQITRDGNWGEEPILAGIYLRAKNWTSLATLLIHSNEDARRIVKEVPTETQKLLESIKATRETI